MAKVFPFSGAVEGRNLVMLRDKPGAVEGQEAMGKCLNKINYLLVLSLATTKWAL